MRAEVVEGKLKKGSPFSAGYDVFANEHVEILPGETKVVSTGLKLRFHNCHALTLDRSGLAAKDNVNRRAGVIDWDYRGEVKIILRNEKYQGWGIWRWIRELFRKPKPFVVRPGDRIAQMVFIPEFHIQVVGTENGTVEVSDVVRGEGGLGSTGR